MKCFTIQLQISSDITITYCHALFIDLIVAYRPVNTLFYEKLNLCYVEQEQNGTSFCL